MFDIAVIFLFFKLYMCIMICSFVHTTFQNKYNQRSQLTRFKVWRQSTSGKCREWERSVPFTAWAMKSTSSHWAQCQPWASSVETHSFHYLWWIQLSIRGGKSWLNSVGINWEKSGLCKNLKMRPQKPRAAKLPESKSGLRVCSGLRWVS